MSVLLFFLFLHTSLSHTLVLFSSSLSLSLCTVTTLTHWPMGIIKDSSHLSNNKPTLTSAPLCHWPEPGRWSPSCLPVHYRAGCRWTRTLWTPWQCGQCGRRSWLGRPNRIGLQRTEWNTWWLWKNEKKRRLMCDFTLLCHVSCIWCEWLEGLSNHWNVTKS